jgi:hypothetical protein
MATFLARPVNQGLALATIVYLARVRFGLHPLASAALGLFLGSVLILVTPQPRGVGKPEVKAAIYETAPKTVKKALDKLPREEREQALGRLETEIRKYASLAA